MSTFEGGNVNLLDAAVQGATDSVFLVGNIAASLVAFLAFMAFVNSLLGWLGEQGGQLETRGNNWI